MLRYVSKLCPLLIALAVGLLFTTQVGAQTADVMVPAGVSFNVFDVAVSTVSSPSTVIVSYQNGTLQNNQALKISVVADTANLTPPSGTGAILASNISWTTSNAVGGTGYNGALSAAAYTPVYLGVNRGNSGSVQLSFTLAPPGASIYAGVHGLVLRWKFEIVPA